MGCCRPPIQYDKCPVCGVSDAYMGSSEFHPFNGLVCSKVCGRLAKKAVKDFRDSSVYEFLMEARSNIDATLNELERDEIAKIYNKVEPVTKEMAEKLTEITDGVDVDLDKPLSPEDD